MRPLVDRVRAFSALTHFLPPVSNLANSLLLIIDDILDISKSTIPYPLFFLFACSLLTPSLLTLSRTNS